jgi:predicted nucleotidyltransferase
MIEVPTDDSVERIYVVNTIRDYLNTSEISERLRELGVNGVNFYGSASSGTADGDSDIDLFVRHSGDEDFGRDYKKKDAIDKRELRNQYELKVQNIFEGANVGKVVGVGSIKERERRSGTVIHLFVFGIRDSYYEGEQYKPAFIYHKNEVGIDIWSSPVKPRARNLLSRVFRLK